MSSVRDRIRSVAAEAAVDVCWRQWRALGFVGAGDPGDRLRTQIDPEALVLASLAFAPHERRLDDATAWWAVVGARWLSVQRTKTLAADFPDPARKALSAFAAQAVAGGDRRWQALATTATPSRPKSGLPTLLDPAALVLRCRAGFGVGLKADVLAFLMAAPWDRGDPDTADLHAALGYTPTALRTALRDLVESGLVLAEGPARRTRYTMSVSAGQWLPGLERSVEPDRLPGWGYWREAFRFWAAVESLVGPEGASRSDYVLASRLDDEVRRLHPPAPASVEHVRPGKPGALDRFAAWFEETTQTRRTRV